MDNLLPIESMLALFQTDKDQRKSFVDSVLLKVSDGEIDAIQLHLQLKCMEDICEQIKANVFYKNLLIEECQKNGKKFTYQNSEFQIKEAGVKYDYSKTQDIELFEMQQQADDLNKKIKIRQEMLKNAPEQGLEIITKDGEVTTVFQPIKTSTTIIQVTLK